MNDFNHRKGCMPTLAGAIVGQNNLIGRYKLITHGTFDKDGIFTATSNYLKGELIYAGEGNLSVLIFLMKIMKCLEDFSLIPVFMRSLVLIKLFTR